MRQAPLAVLCLVSSLFAGTRETKVTVAGKEVVLGPRFEASPLVEVTDLRFYACTLAENDARCTVIAGNVVPHWAPGQQHTVVLELDLYQVFRKTDALRRDGTVRIVIENPPVGRPTKFSAVGPDWYWRQARQAEASRGQKLPKHLRPMPPDVVGFPHYEVRVTLMHYVAPEDDAGR